MNEKQEKQFESLTDYRAWLNALPDPCSGTPLQDGEQEIEDGDGKQYHVTVAQSQEEGKTR